MIFILFLTGASVFSVGGMGEDMSVFRLPFYGSQSQAQLQFQITPEFEIIAKDGAVRNLYWTNPFALNLLIPVGDRVLLSAGNAERFDQSSDIYLERDPLNMHLLAEGGIEEFRLQFNANLPIAELFCSGSYLFGSSREIWEYEIGDYITVDTFNYEYYGSVFSAGLRYRFLAVACEGLGRIKMFRADGDSTVDIPQRLTFGLTPVLGEYRVKLIFEHSFWNGYDSPSRLHLGLGRNGRQISYKFNPWYYNGIQEHGVTLGQVISLKKLGHIGCDLQVSYRSRAGLSEFKIVPELRLTLEEIFSRRKK